MSFRLILASSSRYRRAQLESLRIQFETIAANIDESAQPGEPPRSLALRLAESKARAIAARAPSALVIGCDQTMDCAGRTFGKPLTTDVARAMLTSFSGRRAIFHSAIALIRDRERLAIACTPTTVQFRALSSESIDAYLAREDALDCAGAFKSEALGVALVESIESNDPSALIGLPMIALCRMLRAHAADPLLSVGPAQ
jgi:septum formation protein